MLMGEISTINNPLNAAPDLRNVQGERPAPFPISPAMEDASQLTKLSSILNVFKRSAIAMRAQVTEAMDAVRSGAYHVDPLQVSRSIVLDSLTRR